MRRINIFIPLPVKNSLWTPHPYRKKSRCLPKIMRPFTVQPLPAFIILSFFYLFSIYLIYFAVWLPNPGHRSTETSSLLSPFACFQLYSVQEIVPGTFHGYVLDVKRDPGLENRGVHKVQSLGLGDAGREALGTQPVWWKLLGGHNCVLLLL